MDGLAPAPPRDPAGRTGAVALGDGVGFVVEVGDGPEADEEISRSLAAGVYPPEYRPLLGLLARHAPPGGRVLDLGAHVGTFALAAAASGYEVAAVEASPRNASLLRASIARNGFDRLHLIHAAVSDRPGTLEFDPFGPWGHVVEASGGRPRAVGVPATTVDALLAGLGWDRVDFVKMDVEGSEVAAVGGMPRLLGRPDAPPIVYESNHHTLGFYGRTPADLRAALAAHGYVNHLLDGDRPVPVRPEDDQPSVVVDYLALKPPPAGPRSRLSSRARRLRSLLAGRRRR